MVNDLCDLSVETKSQLIGTTTKTRRREVRALCLRFFVVQIIRLNLTPRSQRPPRISRTIAHPPAHGFGATRARFLLPYTARARRSRPTFFAHSCTAVLPNPQLPRGFYCAKNAQEIARYYWASIAPIGAPTIFAGAGNDFLCFFAATPPNALLWLRLRRAMPFCGQNCLISDLRLLTSAHSFGQSRHIQRRMSGRIAPPWRSEWPPSPQTWFTS